MRGWAVWFRPFSPENAKEARNLFEQALQLDPHSVDAQIGTANLLISWTRFLQTDEAAVQRDVQRAERLLLEALDRDPKSSSGHSVLGVLRRLQNRLDESRVELQKAISFDRNNAGALTQLGITFMYLGEPGVGVPFIEQAIRLDPLASSTATSYWALGSCYLLLARTDEAIEVLRKAVATGPRLWYAHLALAAALGLKGDIAQAQAALAESLRLKPDLNSFARLRAVATWGSPEYVSLREKTTFTGLRRAGFPDE